MLSSGGRMEDTSCLIVRMSHNQAELLLHDCTNQKPNTCLTFEASIIICHLHDRLADRSWYDERHAASHVYYLELEYHAALTISARVSSCELSAMVVRCQARQVGCLVCTSSGDRMQRSTAYPNTRVRMTSTDDNDRTQIAVAFEYMNMLPNCCSVLVLDTSFHDPSDVNPQAHCTKLEPPCN